ncbi:hypothetical protein Lfu02_75380 [Longispora fulva]|uniref:dTMP kinase n=1 Tax=Longispora fulva TaxID=619741 RepID=A0A8J7GEF0_9ACTN|nr:hypothetical protein [Longispora fulva]MBG6136325.1 dTMP kinase [Longispora fulva]GIG63166.1 hypothetical protein Lfu02_75380 [Longispora fulva]
MIIGIEGTSLTGKTTLAAALAASGALRDPLVVPCYWHAAPDPGRLPPAKASSVAGQLAGLEVFLSVEAVRLGLVDAGVREGRDVVVDRTADTLLAHVGAVSAMTEADAYPLALDLIAARRVIVPDLTLHLTARPETLALRARTRPGFPALFVDSFFATLFNKHFTNPAALVTQRCVPVDADADPVAVLATAVAVIAEHSSARTEGTAA